MYIGFARNIQDIENALLLAADCFRNEKDTTVKRLLMSPHKKLVERDMIILINETGDLCGVCFLIDRIFFRGKNRLQGTFLTSICVGESYRGKGLSTLLMNAAIEECERRGSIFAIVIARRAVDHYYNKFHFWGLSQYSTIHIKMADNTEVNYYSNAIAKVSDLFAVNQIYETTYANLYGSCVRTPEYWNHLLWKVKQQQQQFMVFKLHEEIKGYAIFSGNNLYEFAVAKNISNLKLLHDFSSIHSFKDINLFAPREHPLIAELAGLDFTITQRQCSYGGHMVRIINKNKLIECLIDEIQNNLNFFEIDNYIEQLGTNVIELRNRQIKINIDSSLHYENTCFLMGADYLSKILKQPILYKSHTFNIPLMDQA